MKTITYAKFASILRGAFKMSLVFNERSNNLEGVVLTRTWSVRSRVRGTKVDVVRVRSLSKGAPKFVYQVPGELLEVLRVVVGHAFKKASAEKFPVIRRFSNKQLEVIGSVMPLVGAMQRIEWAGYSDSDTVDLTQYHWPHNRQLPSTCTGCDYSYGRVEDNRLSCGHENAPGDGPQAIYNNAKPHQGCPLRITKQNLIPADSLVVPEEQPLRTPATPPPIPAPIRKHRRRRAHLPQLTAGYAPSPAPPWTSST